MILGFKKIPFRLIWLQYDDAETPTALVGKKVAPILHLQGKAPMAESLDIVKVLDQSQSWGPPLLQPASGRHDLKEFLDTCWPLIRPLIHTRFVRVNLPDLALKGGREYFITQHSHQGPSGEGTPEKETWRGWTQSKREAWYDNHFTHSSPLVTQLSTALLAAEPLIHSPCSVSPGGVGYDDIIFFSRMRMVTIIKGLELGPKLAAYLRSMSEQTDMPSFASMAC